MTYGRSSSAWSHLCRPVLLALLQSGAEHRHVDAAAAAESTGQHPLLAIKVGLGLPHATTCFTSSLALTTVAGWGCGRGRGRQPTSWPGRATRRSCKDNDVREVLRKQGAPDGGGSGRARPRTTTCARGAGCEMLLKQGRYWWATRRPSVAGLERSDWWFVFV